MPVRDIVTIDEERCDGCGDCITACAEGAIQLVDGKARLISDVYCDGLGACLGHCPQGAITVERREAAAFDEQAVEHHLERQRSHQKPQPMPQATGCPGSRMQSFQPRPRPSAGAEVGATVSRLGQWPVQLHLLPPTAPFLADRELLVAADCVAYAVGGFHDRFLDGRALAIACPKLDSHQEIYLDKLTTMIDHGGIRSLTVMVMEVPCCGGLIRLVERALAQAGRSIQATVRVVSVQGQITGERPLVNPAEMGRMAGGLPGLSIAD